MIANKRHFSGDALACQTCTICSCRWFTKIVTVCCASSNLMCFFWRATWNVAYCGSSKVISAPAIHTLSYNGVWEWENGMKGSHKGMKLVVAVFVCLFVAIIIATGTVCYVSFTRT